MLSLPPVLGPWDAYSLGGQRRLDDGVHRGALRNDTLLFLSKHTLEKDERTAIKRMIFVRISPDELLQTGEVS